MTPAALLIGVASGFVGSMPVAGPTAALVLTRTLERRRREAWFLAVGSAIPEGLYAFLACWGITAAVVRFPAILGATRVAGGVVLVLIGAWLWRRAAAVGAQRHEDASKGAKSRGALTGLAMTLANPTLLLTWSAAVGVLHSVGLLPVDPRAALPFAAGVAIGVAAWFTVMIRVVEALHDHVKQGLFVGLVRGVGALLVAAGVAVTAHAVAHELKGPWAQGRHSVSTLPGGCVEDPHPCGWQAG